MWPFNRKGPSGFSYSSTAEEVTEGMDGSGLTAIVTGASSGIGTETARVLALRGVHVIMGVRNMEAGKGVKGAIAKEIPAAKIDAMELDLSSMASVRKFASEFNSLNLPLNLLINNAGIMATPFMLSKDNIELQFATNHIGHFLLTNLLLDTMKKTSVKLKKEGRIVNVSSMAHKFTYLEGIRFDRINDQAGSIHFLLKTSLYMDSFDIVCVTHWSNEITCGSRWVCTSNLRYNSIFAYGQSKLANVLHANELSRRLKEDGAEITANSLHPGAVTTNLFRHYSFVEGLVGKLGSYVLKNVQQGAATSCYLALHPQVKGITGEYFADSNLAKPSKQGTDVDLAKKLWDFSMNLVK